MATGKLIAAYAVHALTASGAVLGLFALERAAAGDLRACFALLGAALVVDAVDGPAARRVGVAEALPRFSGVRLDLVVDYLNYCVVPAYAVLVSGMLPASVAAWGAGAMLLSSLFHFADRESKTDDGFFVGFPAIWNVVAFYFYALQPPPLLAAAAVALLTALTFVPLLWAHPLRSPRLRPLTLAVTGGWAVAAISVLWHGAPAGAIETVVLVAAVLYAAGLNLWRSLLAGPPRG